MLAIPGYQTPEKLYESSGSLVYRGRRQSDQLPVVLKILKPEYPSPDQLARFRCEHDITNNLKLDGVIKVHGFERCASSLAMVLEDFGAESLARHLPGRTLDLPDLLRLAIRITEILGEVHHQQVMHKDINPSNIVWNPATDELKLIDFGLATMLSREEPSVRNPNLLQGTLAYMSPEQTGRMNRAIDSLSGQYVESCHQVPGQRPWNEPKVEPVLLIADLDDRGVARYRPETPAREGEHTRTQQV